MPIILTKNIDINKNIGYNKIKIREKSNENS
jgi:hypothetical protein